MPSGFLVPDPSPGPVYPGTELVVADGTTGRTAIGAVGPADEAGITFGITEDVHLYLSGATLKSDALLELPKAATTRKGLQVGAAASEHATYVQGGVAGSRHGWIGHNAWADSTGAWKFDTTHASFGARGILFSASAGIVFYADAGATVAGDPYAPTVERLVVAGDGDVSAPTLGKGFVMKSPDGNRWRLTISNAGVVAATAL